MNLYPDMDFKITPLSRVMSSEPELYMVKMAGSSYNLELVMELTDLLILRREIDRVLPPHE